MAGREGKHIRLADVSKTYREHAVKALSSINLEIEKGEFVALVGPSGCGKSTLLNLLAGIDAPSTGRIWLDTHELSALPDRDLTRLRASRVGFVFQFFNLLSTLTVEENVSLPLQISGVKDAGSIKTRTAGILEAVGLKERARFYPSQLSGGEMQRAAIARALVHEPELIVADEPTGNLDSENGRQVLSMLKESCRSRGHTIVMATHSSEAAAEADRIVHMKDGRIVNEERQ